MWEMVCVRVAPGRIGARIKIGRRSWRAIKGHVVGLTQLRGLVVLFQRPSRHRPSLSPEIDASWPRAYEQLNPFPPFYSLSSARSFVSPVRSQRASRNEDRASDWRANPRGSAMTESPSSRPLHNAEADSRLDPRQGRFLLQKSIENVVWTSLVLRLCLFRILHLQRCCNSCVSIMFKGFYKRDSWQLWSRL